MKKEIESEKKRVTILFFKAILIFSVMTFFITGKVYAEELEAIDITTSVIIENLSEKVSVGDSGTFKYHLRFDHIENFQDISVTGTAKFVSHDPDVLKIDGEGNWNALKPGIATITCNGILSDQTILEIEKKFPGTSLIKSEPQQSFEIEVAKEAVTGENEGKISTYRVYNPNSGEHFYTVDESEKKFLVQMGWNDEGIGWYSSKLSKVPVYRAYNPNAGNHHFTIDKSEVDTLSSLGWKDEGIAFYSSENGESPIYRVYNQQSGLHLFTVNKKEQEHLVQIGWKDEGRSWYEQN